MSKPKPKSAPKPRGRPVTRWIKLDAASEEVARAMFAAVKPPVPSKRVRRAGQTMSRGNRELRVVP